MKLTKASTFRLDGFPIPSAPSETMGSGSYPYLKKVVGDKVVIGFLIDSEADSNPLEDVDGDGRIYVRQRWDCEDNTKIQEALGLDKYWEPIEGKSRNPYAVMLDCFSHGLSQWSVSGEGWQCGFDTSRGAGFWVPDESALDSMRILAAEEAGKDASPEAFEAAMQKQAREFARQACESYTNYINGACYEGLVLTFSAEDKSLLDTETVDQIFGSDAAYEELKATFDATDPD